MKILLQPEAKKVSTRDLERNQQYLIDLYEEIYSFYEQIVFRLRQLFGGNICQ